MGKILTLPSGGAGYLGARKLPKNFNGINWQSPQATNLRHMVWYHYASSIWDVRELVSTRLFSAVGSQYSYVEIAPKGSFGNVINPITANSDIQLNISDIGYTPNGEEGTFVAWVNGFDNTLTGTWYQGVIGNPNGIRAGINARYSGTTVRVNGWLSDGTNGSGAYEATAPMNEWVLGSFRWSTDRDIMLAWIPGYVMPSTFDITAWSAPVFPSTLNAFRFSRQATTGMRYYDRWLTDDEIWAMWDPVTRFDILIPDEKHWFVAAGTPLTGTKQAYVKGQDTTSATQQAYIEGTAIIEYLRPDADGAASGTWRNELDATSPLYPSIDEASPSDADYVYGDLININDYVEFPLSDPTDAPIKTGYIVRWRMRRKPGTNSQNIKMEVRQGSSTVIASQTNNVTSDAFSLYTYNLTSGEMSNITKHTDLRVRFTLLAQV